MTKISDELSSRMANMGFVCALLVVFIHIGFGSYQRGSGAWYVTQIFRSVIADIAVPYFFLKAGFFLAKHFEETGWWLRAVKTRVRTLLVPFAFWGCLMFALCHLVVPLLGMGRCPLTFESATIELGLRPPALPNPAVLWFLRSLFVFVIVSPIIALGIEKMGRWLMIPVCMIYFFGGFIGLDILNYLAIPPRDFCFFVVGAFLYKYPIRISRMVCNRLGVVGFLLGCLAFVLEARGVAWVKWLRHLAIPLVMIGCVGIVPYRKWPRCLVENAFSIFILHLIFVRVLDHFPIKSTIPTVLSVAVYWVVAVAGAICFSAVIRFVHPRFACLIFGGR